MTLAEYIFWFGVGWTIGALLTPFFQWVEYVNRYRKGYCSTPNHRLNKIFKKLGIENKGTDYGTND